MFGERSGFCVACSMAAHTRSASPASASASYQLVYFNTRGIVEPLRVLLALSGARWEDIRYPLGLAASGFALPPEYLRDRAAGRFVANMDNLPILIVREEGAAAAFTIGQSHAIARYLASRHGLMGSTPREAAAIDCLYESARDIKSAWLKVKGTADVPGEASPGQARRDAKAIWWSSEFAELCAKLEAAARAMESNDDEEGAGRAGAPSAACSSSSSSPTPWLVGSRVSLADVAIYHLLSAAESIVTGAMVSFFDGDGQEQVRLALSACPKLKASVQAVGALRQVQEWEETRPDTFS